MLTLILALAFLADVSYSDTPAVNLEAETSTSKPLSVLLVTGLYPGHLFPLVSLGEELVRRGHNVTLCANVMRGSHLYPDVPERVGIKFVSAGYDELYTQDFFEEVHATNSFNLTVMKSILRIYLSSYIQIRSKVEEMGIDHFDIIVSEVAATPVAVYFHVKDGMKAVVLNTLMTLPLAIQPSWPTPLFSSGQTDDLSFLDRLMIVSLNPGMALFFDEVFEKVSRIDSSYKEVVHDKTMMSYPGLHIPLIMNTAYGFDYPKTRYPLIEYVGPILMNSLPQLDESLQEWLNSRQEKSVIYISMGTTGLLSVETATAILEGVMATPYHAVWAMKKKSRKLLGEVDFEAYQDRLYLAEWVPQQTVLQHRAILMTILNCGLNGVQESLYNSLPVICVPHMYMISLR